jgi:hypothetical protein
VPAPDAMASWFNEKTPEPGPRAGFFRLGPPRRFRGIPPGAGDEAMVGGEDGGKGDGAAAGLVSMMEGVGRTVTASCTFESVPVVAVRRDCGGSLRRTIRDREPELRREVGGEEASMSIAQSNAGKEVFVKSQSRRVSQIYRQFENLTLTFVPGLGLNITAHCVFVNFGVLQKSNLLSGTQWTFLTRMRLKWC